MHVLLRVFVLLLSASLTLVASLVQGQAVPAAPADEDSKRPEDEPKKSDPKASDEQRAGPGSPDADYLALADSPLFLPRSYLYWGTKVGSPPRSEELVFALEYALHLPIYNNLRYQALTGQRWAGATTLSFEGDLRMIATDSKPVRMPSYRPNISGQLFHIWHRDQPVVLGLRTGVYHYSNGQEQCTFSPDYTDDSEACRKLTDEVVDARRSLNNKNGNFSTNGFIFELFGRIHQVNAAGVTVAHLALGQLFAGMINRGPGAMEPALRRLYGWGKLTTVLEGQKRLGWASVTARGSFVFYPGASDRVPNLSGSAELVLGPYWLTGIGFFARYYGGRDFYNAFFVDNLHQFAAGIAWDGERPLKFKRE